ncbi:MAG: hypothetical protein IJ642_11635 [Oscillospiraceae bacterium]|nr:hypothetical protein [Oscillospiraceae bacterium]
MKKTIDLTYKEVSDKQEGKSLFGKSTQTVKKTIAALEEKYFIGRNIFRNNDTTSDFLFRYEIKNLLLLLIKLEMDDVFSDAKAKADGVSTRGINKILESYKLLNDDELLRDYEYRVLLQLVNADESVHFIETMDAFQTALATFLTLTVKYYDKFSTDFFEDIIYKLNEWSRNIIYWTDEVSQLEKSHKKIIDFNPYHLKFHERTESLTLNLKTAVVKTINILADELYQFDENGVCIRKNLEPLGEAEIENPYTQIVEYEEKLDDEKADEIHAGMDRVMNSYWKKAFPNQMQQSRFQHNTSQQIENEIENLKIITGKYIDLYVNVRAACSGRIRFAPNGNVFKEYDELRQILEARMLSDLPFKDYLRELEEEGWMLFISGKRNPSKGKKLVSKYVDKFKEDSDKLRKAARSEFDKIQNKNFKETELEGTESNITELYKQCESLAENMLAVILKIEADKEKKKQDSPAP